MSYSETWPRAGMMRNGTAYQRRPLAPLTAVTGYSLLPTATALDSYSVLEGATWSGCAAYVNGVKRNTDLAAYLRHCGRDDLATFPMFREWLMGFPIRWTETKR